MGFNLSRTPTYKKEITVHMPNEKGGFDAEKFTAHFKRFDTEELDELRKKTGKEVLDAALVGWSDMFDNGQPVEFSEERRAAMYKIPQALAATLDAFWASIFKAKQGN